MSRTLLAASAALAAVITLGAAAEGNSPRVNYMLHCMGCHLDQGQGFPGKVPNMNGVAGKFLHVPGGREYLVRVPGVAQSSLNDDELAAVVNWLLTEFSGAELPADFEAYTAAEIGRLRQEKLTEVTETRERLLAAYEAKTAAR